MRAQGLQPQSRFQGELFTDFSVESVYQGSFVRFRIAKFHQADCRQFFLARIAQAKCNDIVALAGDAQFLRTASSSCTWKSESTKVTARRDWTWLR